MRRLSPLVGNWWSQRIIMHHISTKLMLPRILKNWEIIPTRTFLVSYMEKFSIRESPSPSSASSMIVNCESFWLSTIWKVPFKVCSGHNHHHCHQHHHHIFKIILKSHIIIANRLKSCIQNNLVSFITDSLPHIIITIIFGIEKNSMGFHNNNVSS